VQSWLLAAVHLLAGTQRATAYYMGNHAFGGKMALFVFIVLLELAPMRALSRWRRLAAAGQLPDTSRAAGFARTSVVQAVLVALIVLVATAMARGYGAR
jgi:putative membrane protein